MKIECIVNRTGSYSLYEDYNMRILFSLGEEFLDIFD